MMRRVGLNDQSIVRPLFAKPVFRGLAVAASFSVIIAFGAIFSSNEVVLNNGEESLSHFLPDGSEVILAQGSELEYNSLLWNLKRKMDFSGQGFFQVIEGSDFRVQTESGDVTVLGTSFSVNTRADGLKVICKTGKVKVTSTAEESNFLTPGLGVEIDNEIADLFPYSAENVDSWVGGKYEFNEATLEEVFEAAEEFTGFEIEYPDNLKQSFSGELFPEQTVDEALTVICKATGLSFNIDRDHQIVQIQNS